MTAQPIAYSELYFSSHVVGLSVTRAYHRLTLLEREQRAERPARFGEFSRDRTVQPRELMLDLEDESRENSRLQLPSARFPELSEWGLACRGLRMRRVVEPGRRRGRVCAAQRKQRLRRGTTAAGNGR